MSCVMGVGSGLLAGVAAYRSSQEYKYKQIIHFESEAFLKLERSLRSQWVALIVYLCILVLCYRF